MRCKTAEWFGEEKQWHRQAVISDGVDTIRCDLNRRGRVKSCSAMAKFCVAEARLCTALA